MTFKKILCLLLVFCMIFSLVGCAGKDTDDDEDSKSASGKKGGIFSKNNSVDDDEKDSDDKDADSKDSDDKDADSKDSDDKDADSKDSDDDVISSKDDDNPYEGLNEVDLPKGYPEKIFPMYKGGKVYAANNEEQDNLNTFTVMAVFNEKIETVDKFYKETIKAADDLVDHSGDGFISYSGTLEGYQFAFTLISDSDNDKYSLITLELEEIPTVAHALESLAEGELPDNYPVNLFPIIDGGALYSSNESENDGKTSYSLTIYTEKSFKEIVAFYEEKIGAIEDKAKSISTDYFNLDGTANKYDFYINGDKVTENNVELTRYYLSIDPVSE